MSALKSTLKLYGACFDKAVRALPKSWPAALALVLYALILGALSVVLAPTGIAGGFVIGLVHAGCAGAYLYLVEQPVLRGTGVSLSDIQDSAGTYLWDVISILFIFWIGSMVLGVLLPGPVLLVVYLLVFVLCNPIPELIYQGHSRSIAALQDAFGFVKQNWPEWFAPHLVLVPLAFAGPLGGAWLELLSMFGPFFGFLGVADPLVSALLHRHIDIALILQTLVLLAIVHTFMLFRGFLYKELGSGGRRARAWKARMGR